MWRQRQLIIWPGLLCTLFSSQYMYTLNTFDNQKTLTKVLMEIKKFEICVWLQESLLKYLE